MIYLKLLLALFLLPLPLQALSFLGSMIEADQVDYEENKLVFQGHVLVKQENRSLAANHAALIKEEDQYQLRMEGDVELFQEGYGELRCASASFDSKSGKGLLQGSIEAPVTYKGPLGTLLAPAIELNFIQKDGQIIFTKVVACGGVRAINQLPLERNAQGTVLRYIVADQITFFPQTLETALTSHLQKKVILFDACKKTTLFADSIQIKPDPKKQKDLIQGCGRVCIRFEQDWPQLRYYFPQSSSNQVKP